MTVPRVVFVVPCHGREQLAAVCLRQLVRTCAELAPAVDASAVLVSDEAAFGVLADELGFAHVVQANSPLGRKWNDGFEHALGELAADFVVPFGSDDVVDARLIGVDLPPPDTIRCSRLSAIVREDGRRLAHLNVTYPYGDGVRTIPAAILRLVGGRPAADERERAIDGSISDKLHRAGLRPRLRYVDVHPLQILDFKSPAGQLNTYSACVRGFGTGEFANVWERIGEHYPAEFVEEIRAVYEPVRRRVAA